MTMPAARRRGTHTGRCRWCDKDVLFLTHVETGKVAPIDPDRVVGGNIAVARDADGWVAGTYEVVGTVEARRAVDPSVDDPDAMPALHVNHWATCEVQTARRKATSPAAPAQPGPLEVEDPPPLEDPPDADALADRAMLEDAARHEAALLGLDDDGADCE